MKKTKVFLSVAALLGFGLLSAELGASVTGHAGLKGLNASTTGNKFFSAYASMDDVGEAGQELTREIAGEGIVMLKNNGVLPFTGVKNVTVFGKNSVATNIGGGGSGASKGYYEIAGLYDGLEEAGYNVNPAQKAFYEDDTRSMTGRTSGGMGGGGGFTIGETPVDLYEDSVKSTWATYSDAAIITIVRTGSEGADEPVTGIVDHAGDKTEVDHHYLELSENEKDMIKMVKESHLFSKIVVVLNCTNVVELADLENDDEIDAMLWTGGVGGTGFLAIGDILSGAVNPSGKTVDIFPADLMKDPTSMNFGTNAQNQANNKQNYMLTPDTTDANYSNYESVWYSTGRNGAKSIQANIAAYTNYEEDVYLGYRYYETKGDIEGGTWYQDNVVYPFGFGLSFTTFAMAGSEVSYNATTHDMSMTVTVENTGDVAGKQVVELYVEAPYTSGEIEKPTKVLVAFGKTSVLQPGESEAVVLTWKDTDVASYDAEDKNNNGFQGYEMDAGSYKFHVSTDSHNVEDTITWTLAEDAKLTTSGYNDNNVHNLFSSYITNGNLDADVTTKLNPYRSLPVAEDGLVVERMSRTNDLALPAAPKAAGDAESTVKGDGLKVMSTVITASSLESDTDQNGYIASTMRKTEADVKARFGDDYTQGDTTVALDFYDLAGVDPEDNTNKYQNTDAKAAYYTTNADLVGLTGFQIYQKVMNKVSWEGLYKALDGNGWHSAAVAEINKPQTTDVDGPSAIYRVDYPTACTLAATFNVELAERFGSLIGEESLWGLRPGWYGPAMDTHRSAFSGRNFEYYSEDGLLGGMIGAYSIKAAQAKGCYAFMKHMALNDCETQRNGNHAFVSEQAIREIYFKPFRLSVEIGGALAVMGGMNSIGYIANYDNYAEMTQMLRDEWGFKGFVETDAGSFNYGTSPYSNGFMARIAGCDTLLGFGGSPSGLGTWDATKKVPVITSDSTSTELWTTYYYYRQSLQYWLYSTANSSIYQNGLDWTAWADKEEAELTTPVQSDYSLNVAVDTSVLGTSNVWYEVTGGELPTGMSMDIYGNITGACATSGDYTFTVTAYADGWIAHTKQYTIHVVDAFALSANTGAVGTAFSGAITSEYVQNVTNADGSGHAVTYGLADGSELPAGLTLNADGTITGTPTTPGTYTFTIHVIDLVTTIGSSGRKNYTSNEYEQTFTMTITGEAVVEDEVTAEEAKEAADAAKEAADAAKEAADAAKTAADAAKTAADAAAATANEAKTAADAATATANEAKTAAENAAKTSGGCGGSIIAATSTIGAISLLGVGLALKKRKEDK